MPIRLLLIASSCNPEWVSESAVGFQWFRHLSEKHEVILVTREVNRRALERAGFRNVFYIKIFKILGLKSLHEYAIPDYFYFNLMIWFTLKKKIKSFQPDLIHLLTPIAPRFSTYLSYLDIPLVVGPLGGALKVHPSFLTMEKLAIIRNLYHDFSRFRTYFDPFLVHTYTKATRILVTCNYVRSKLRPKWREKTIQILETAVDESYFEITPNQNNFPVRIIYVGRLFPLKGVELLMRAFGSVAGNGGMILDIVGSGPQEKFLKNLAGELGVSDKVSFYGWLSPKEVKKMYGRSNIFCLPTIKDASGNVLLEAMAASLPIITTNYAGPAEIVSKECAILINLTNRNDFVDQLARAISKLSQDAHLRITMGESGKKRCREFFTWESKMKRVSEIYDEILSGTPPVFMS